MNLMLALLGSNRIFSLSLPHFSSSLSVVSGQLIFNQLFGNETKMRRNHIQSKIVVVHTFLIGLSRMPMMFGILLRIVIKPKQAII